MTWTRPQRRITGALTKRCSEHSGRSALAVAVALATLSLGPHALSQPVNSPPSAPQRESVGGEQYTDRLSTTRYGAKADGISDDSDALQKALTKCSNNNLTCEIPAGRTHRVTKPLFLWGGANLISSAQGGISFDAGNARYLLNLGISAKANQRNPRGNLRQPFSGRIEQVTFTIAGGAPPDVGRMLFFWRTDGATLYRNDFRIGSHNFSATSSGNDNDWVVNGHQNCIRRDIVIMHNTISATATNKGNEGIGLGLFDGALIADNVIKGVGDDPIGIHLSKRVKILRNVAESVDGRIFVSNSEQVDIVDNRHTRVASPLTGQYYQGIGLIYVGFEGYSLSPGNRSPYPAPQDIHIRNNELYYPRGSIDGGAAIYIYAPRRVMVENNLIVNHSLPTSYPLYGIHVLPALVSGWTDPAGIDDLRDNRGRSIARVHDISIRNNHSTGSVPLSLVMSGNCSQYAGHVSVTGNEGPSIARRDHDQPGFRFYCLGETVSVSGNRSL